MKIQEEVALILARNIDTHSTKSRQQIAEDIHRVYLTWLEYHLPDMEGYLDMLDKNMSQEGCANHWFTDDVPQLAQTIFDAVNKEVAKL